MAIEPKGLEMDQTPAPSISAGLRLLTAPKPLHVADVAPVAVSLYSVVPLIRTAAISFRSLNSGPSNRKPRVKDENNCGPAVKEMLIFCPISISAPAAPPATPRPVHPATVLSCKPPPEEMKR